jgi:hypothetical protein
MTHFIIGGNGMNLKQLEIALCNTFGEKNVKPHAKGFRVIVDYENMPYCIVLRAEQNRLVMERDAIDENEENYDEAYRKAYKMLLQNKDKFNGKIDI